MTSFGMTFSAHGMPGSVEVIYTVNHDPADLGFDRLGLDGPGMALDFPVLGAEVQYDGAGYFRYMGWVQVVRAVLNGDNEEVIIDKPPSMKGVQQPFAAWGPCPRFFDAPGTTDRPVAWRADTSHGDPRPPHVEGCPACLLLSMGIRRVTQRERRAKVCVSTGSRCLARGGPPPGKRLSELGVPGGRLREDGPAPSAIR